MFSIRRSTLIVLLAIAFASLCAAQASEPTLVTIKAGRPRGRGGDVIA